MAMEDLITRCLSGDAAAADELCRLYLGRIREYAVSRGATLNDADDIAQETLIAALARFKEGLRPQRLTWWLLGIARNLHRNLRRSPGKKLDEQALFEDGGRGARTVAMRKELNELLLRSIDSLPEGDRELLTMLHRQGLDRKAVAERLGLELRTLHARCERAHARLRESVGEHFTTVARRRMRPAGVTLEAVLRLRPAARQVVMVRHLQGKSDAEAMRTLALPEPTYRARLKAAYEALGCDGDTDFGAARKEHQARKSGP
jgi:RNA polymerase sigma-70 factor (ECF subfamily)